MSRGVNRFLYIGCLRRRAFLQSLAASLVLPAFPSLGHAETGDDKLLVFFVPNGHLMEAFTPMSTRDGLQLAELTSVLERHVDRLTFVSGLRSVGGDLGGIDPHSTAVGSLLTGHPVDPSLPLAANNDVSVDQVLADHLSVGRRFRSVDLSSEQPPICRVLNTDYQPDLNCAYFSHLSWSGPGMPTPRLYDTRAVFERLFGDLGGPVSTAARLRRQRYRKSVLDTVLGELSTVHSALDATDRDQLDAYLTSLRQVEQSMDASAASCADPALAEAVSGPVDAQAHVQQMVELLVLALQCGQTNVATYMLGTGASIRPFPWLGVPDAHHPLSHHAGVPEAIDKEKRIEAWELGVFAGLLDRLEEAADGAGSLLDSTQVLYAAAMGDGDSHDLEELPLILAGRGLPGGRRVHFEAPTNVNGLWVSLLQSFGLSHTTFGATDDPALPGVF